MNRLYLQQHFKAESDEIWKFIAAPVNLDEVTPPYLDFSLASEVPDEIYEGLQVRFEISLPLLGDIHWVTEIKDVIPGQQFVEKQTTGPYALWNHYHGLEEVEDGVIMTDRVHYLLPYGPVGVVANNLFVGRRLYAIFKYRYDMLDLIFNS